MADLAGHRFARVVHSQQVPLGSLDKRLKGVTVTAPVPVMVGDSGGRAAVMGQLPEPVSTEREAQAFVESLLSNGQIELGSRRAAPAAVQARGAAARSRAGAASGAQKAVPRETHRVASVGGKKVLVRMRFQCPCD